MGKENKNNHDTNENSFKGFSIVNADVLGDLDTEIKDVDNIEDIIDDDNEPINSDIGAVNVDPEEIEVEQPTDKVENKGKKKEAVETEVENDDDDDKDEPSSIKVFADYLGEKGIIEIEEDFEDSEEGLEKAITTRIEKGINEYKDSLGDISKQYIEFIENGGDPKKFIESYSAPDYSELTDEDLEEESIQEQLVRESLYLEGYSQEEIRDEIEDYKEGGILANKAKRAKNRLVKYAEHQKSLLLEQQKKDKLKREEAREEAVKKLETDIQSKQEIAGFEIKDKDKKTFFEYISKINPKTGKTKLIESIEADPDYQLKMAWLLYNKFDFSKLEKKAEKKALSSLKDKLDLSTVRGNKLKSKEKINTGAGTFTDFKKAL